jgi:hypothetical protein
MKTISFTQEYLKVIDDLLSSCYNKVTTREHYLLFLERLEYKMAYCCDNEIPYINNNVERIKYGLTSLNKKRVWRMDILIKNLIKKDILVATTYQKEKGLCRKYFYSPYFSYLLSEHEHTIVNEEIPEELYIKIVANYIPPTEPYLIPQYELLKSDRFRIDSVKAIEWIQNQDLTFDRKRIYLRYVLDINDKRIIATKGEHSNRLFTNFNLMKREFREFCTIDNKPLLSIDLKSSQPFLFASYMLDKYPSYEAKRFFDLVTNDDIYLWFLNKWNERDSNYYMIYDKAEAKKIKKEIKNREDAKPEFLKLLFKIGGVDPPFTLLFKREFPSLYNSLLLEKATLCKSLQQKESYLFVPLCNQFAQRGALSVHDSLYFVKDIQDELLNELKKRFKQLNLNNYTLKNKN